MKQFDKAIALWRRRWRSTRCMRRRSLPLARTLQRSGHTTEAKVHFQSFQHLANTKISSPIGFSYGEQGHYSVAVTVAEPEAGRKRDDSRAAGGESHDLPECAAGPTTTGGACMMDVTGDGRMDLVLMQSGAQAIRVLHNKGDGSFEEWNAEAAG